MKLSINDMADVYELRQNKVSIEDIAEVFNVNEWTIRMYIFGSHLFGFDYWEDATLRKRANTAFGSRRDDPSLQHLWVQGLSKNEHFTLEVLRELRDVDSLAEGSTTGAVALSWEQQMAKVML